LGRYAIDMAIHFLWLIENIAWRLSLSTHRT
jgi:hypothetical protein